MRISDWSSDVCSSDLPTIWCTISRCTVAMQRFKNNPLSATSRNAMSFATCFTRAAHQRHRPVRSDKNVTCCQRSEERRVGKECVSRVDLGGRRIIKKKLNIDTNTRRAKKYKK